MDVNSIAAAGGMTGALTGGTAASNLGKEDFLKLLVTQLSHQDPLAPMENTEFVAQLAQFSSLEQLLGVNNNLGLLQVAQTAMTNSQVAGLIGKEVEAKGDVLQHTAQGSADVNFDLGAAAKDVTIKITDKNGNLIRTISAENKNSGLNTVLWDGKDNAGNLMPTGTYGVSVTAKDSSGNSIAVSSRFKGMVTGVSYKGGVPQLEIGSTTVKVGDVIAVRQATGSGTP